MIVDCRTRSAMIDGVMLSMRAFYLIAFSFALDQQEMTIETEEVTNDCSKKGV